MSARELKRKITDLCVFIYTEVSSMQCPDDTITDLRGLLEQKPQEALGFIAQTIASLLQFKREYQSKGSFKDAQQHQKSLQKLESEVGNHIKLEQQMKLALKNTQNRLEDSEESVLNMKAENSQLEMELKKHKKLYIEKARDFEILLQKHQKLRHSQPSNENAQHIIGYYKQRYENKCEELDFLEKQLNRKHQSKSPLQSRALSNAGSSRKLLPSESNKRRFSSANLLKQPDN